MKNLLILGAGGFGQMVKETALMLGYEQVVFLDDAAKRADVVGKCCQSAIKESKARCHKKNKGRAKHDKTSIS